MQLENMMEMYQPKVSMERQQTYFVVGDLENLSAGALYGYGNGGNSGGNGSGFVPASSFGLGPGIAKETESGFIERYRAGKHEDFGKDHVNLEYISPVTLKTLINLHIDMKDK